MPNRRNVCRNLYAFIRFRLGRGVSDREIARRWKMEWKSFNGLRHGKRQVPRIADLERLAAVLDVDAAFVFEVARGVPARRVHSLLEKNDREALAGLLMAGVQAAHRQSESRSHRFEAILDRVEEAVFTLDIQGRFQDVNRRVSAMTGFSSDELLTRSLFDLLSARQRPELVAAAAAVFQHREGHATTLTIRTKDGEERLLELGLARIDDEDGTAIGLQGIARDITERRRLENALRQQNAVLASTFDSIPAAALLFAKDGTILLANRLVENVCEWTAAEVSGRNAHDVFGNPGPVGCPVTRAFQTGSFEQQVSKVRNRKGDDVFVHRTAGPVVAENGEVEQVIEILVDVTEQVRRSDPKLLLADIDRRQFLRVPLGTPVRYRVGRKAGKAVVSNVSRGGLFLEDATKLPIGTKLSLEWSLPGTRRTLEATGEVAWVDPRVGSRGIGIRFEEVPVKDRQAIVSWITARRTKSAR